MVRIVNLIMQIIPAGSLVAWTVAMSRRYDGRSFLPHESRRPVPWGLVDLFLLIVMLLVVQLIFVTSAKSVWGISLTDELSEMLPIDQAKIMALFSLATFVTWLLGMKWMRWRQDASWLDLGWQRKTVVKDVRIGVFAYLMLITPVFAIQFILTRWMETKHPLIELLRENPDPWFFAFSGIAAVVIAPVVEEYFFRVFLQGWLENVSFVIRARWPISNAGQSLILGAVARRLSFSSHLQTAQDSDDGFAGNASELPLNNVSDETSGLYAMDTQQLGRNWIPIVVSATCFAIAHISHGPDPIPLFVLALGLGYVYQRSHRVLPCIVIHMLVNGISMMLLWVSVQQPVSGG